MAIRGEPLGVALGINGVERVIGRLVNGGRCIGSVVDPTSCAKGLLSAF